MWVGASCELCVYLLQLMEGYHGNLFNCGLNSTLAAFPVSHDGIWKSKSFSIRLFRSLLAGLFPALRDFLPQCGTFSRIAGITGTKYWIPDSFSETPAHLFCVQDVYLQPRRMSVFLEFWFSWRNLQWNKMPEIHISNLTGGTFSRIAGLSPAMREKVPHVREKPGPGIGFQIPIKKLLWFKVYAQLQQVPGWYKTAE